MNAIHVPSKDEITKHRPWASGRGMLRHSWYTAGIERNFDIRCLLNGLIDQVLHAKGLVDTTLPFAGLRRRSRINDDAAAASDFPGWIREGMPTINP